MIGKACRFLLAMLLLEELPASATEAGGKNWERALEGLRLKFCEALDACEATRNERLETAMTRHLDDLAKLQATLEARDKSDAVAAVSAERQRLTIPIEDYPPSVSTVTEDFARLKRQYDGRVAAIHAEQDTEAGRVIAAYKMKLRVMEHAAIRSGDKKAVERIRTAISGARDEFLNRRMLTRELLVGHRFAYGHKDKKPFGVLLLDGSGKVKERVHKNEARWEVVGEGTLIFRHEDGRVSVVYERPEVRNGRYFFTGEFLLKEGITVTLSEIE